MIIPNVAGHYNAMLAGQIDVLGMARERNVQRAIRNKKINVTSGYNNFGGSNITWNNSKPPFNDIRIRKALFQALNRRVLTRINARIAATPANDTFGKFSPWHCPNTKWPKYDPENAKRLLAEYGKPVKFTFTTRAGANNSNLSEAMQAMWRRVGIDVSLKVGPRGPSYPRSAQQGKFEVFYAINGQVADPSMAHVNMHSSNPNNFSHVKDPELDAAIDRMRNAGSSRDARHKRSCELQQLLADKLYYIIWEPGGWNILTRARVKGVTPPVNLSLMAHRYRIEE